MNNKRKRTGFTLIELIVTIVLLAIIGVIIVYNMTSVNKSSKDTEYDRFIAAVKSAAAIYADTNEDAFSSLYVDKAYVYIEMNDLVTSGLIDEDLENPYTNKKVDLSELIKANLDSTSGAVTFTYPLNDENKETFLSAVSDYVVWGESYDCKTGAGSYQLALSDEDGNLIDMSDAANVEQYAFDCKMPTDFDKEKSGSYNVEYTWLTSSGTKKTGTRTLRVLEKVTPTFLTYQGTTGSNSYSDYDYDGLYDESKGVGKNPSTYDPSYNVSTKNWTYLAIKPFIEGSDASNTTFQIFKESLTNDNSKVAVTDIISDYYTYPVDDGNKIYTIETKITGHYDKSYSYNAEGKFHVISSLVLPSSLINGNATTWNYERGYTVSNTYSPVGVAYYEYKLSTDSKKPSDSISVDNSYTFEADSAQTLTSKLISIARGTCSNTGNYEFPYIYFRAINNDGYVGQWSSAVTANLTNKIDNLIDGNSEGCSNANNCCLNYASGSCRFTSKVKYLKIGNRNFVILEKSNGQLLVTLDGVYNRFSPTELKSDSWGQQTCDGYFYANYTYSSPLKTSFYSAANNPATSFEKELGNYINVSKHVVLKNNWTFYYGENSGSSTYSSRIGTVSWPMIRTYGSALTEPANSTYWITNMFYNSFRVVANLPHYHGGENTTKYNTYFYASTNGSVSTAFAGQSQYFKPVFWLKDIVISGGSGTTSDPYMVCDI